MNKKLIAFGIAGTILIVAGFIVLLYIMFSVYGGPTAPWEREDYETWKSRMDEVFEEDFSVGAMKILILEGCGSIRTFLNDDTTEEQKEGLERDIEQMPEVESVEYISKEEAFEQFREKYADEPGLVEEIEGNPFPAEFKICVKDDLILNVEAVCDMLRDRPEISVDPETGEKEIKEPSALYLEVKQYEQFLSQFGFDYDDWMEESENEIKRKRRIAIGTYLIVVFLGLLIAAALLIRSSLKKKSGIIESI